MNAINTKVLIVEDDEDICLLLKTQLELASFTVLVANDGMQALAIVEKTNQIDLIILDWMLPLLNGVEVCQQLRIREKTKTTPIILLTSLAQNEFVIKGLDAGADDFITKPFDMTVLLARARALLRRSDLKFNKSETLIYQPLEIHPNKCDVYLKSEKINLTSTEYQILLILARNPGHVFTREQVIDQVQGTDVFITSRTIDTHIAGLRKKLRDAAHFIETIRGIGYRFSERPSLTKN